MAFFKIDVDEEIYQFLKKNADPFEDTPNSVLKRLLLGGMVKRAETPVKTHTADDFPDFSPSVPHALAEILEVVHGVKKLGLSRKQATNAVAKKRRITPQAVLDKYCRQLGKRAYEIDALLEPKNPEGLQALLLEKFRNNRDVVRGFFQSLAA
jgi:negative regulator of replication initiation